LNQSCLERPAKSFFDSIDPIRTRDVQCNRPVPPLTDIREIGILQSPSQAGGEAHGYGSNVVDRERQVRIYTGRILKGEKPADLPIQRASKFEFT
jgi:hypothetical protein